MAGPSGTNVILESGDYRATVVEVGAGLRTLTRAGLDVVAGYDESEMCPSCRGQVLLPWPNRIEDGRYRFGGRDWQLPLSEPARHNASHGLTRWVTWTLAESSRSSARWRYLLHPQPGYPGDLAITVDYRLSDTGLVVETSATNIGSEPAPYGTGAHPYLSVGRRIDGCELVLPAAIRTPGDERGIPGPPEGVGEHGFDFRTQRRIGAAVFDDAFGDLEYVDQRATAVLRDPDTGRTATIWLEPPYRWLQVFSGDGLGDRAREALAIEPMTCPPNSFATRVDLIVLEPGQTQRTIFGIS